MQTKLRSTVAPEIVPQNLEAFFALSPHWDTSPYRIVCQFIATFAGYV